MSQTKTESSNIIGTISACISSGDCQKLDTLLKDLLSRPLKNPSSIVEFLSKNNRKILDISETSAQSNDIINNLAQLNLKLYESSPHEIDSCDLTTKALLLFASLEELGNPQQALSTMLVDMVGEQIDTLNIRFKLLPLHMEAYYGSEISTSALVMMETGVFWDASGPNPIYKETFNVYNKLSMFSMDYKTVSDYSSSIDPSLLNFIVTDADQLYTHTHTLLHRAILEKDLTTCKFLIHHLKAPLNATTSKLETPLHLAARIGSVEMVQEILSSATDKEALLAMTTADGETALHIAASDKNLAMVRELISNASDKDQCILQTNSKGKTIICTSIENSDAEVLREVLENAPDVKNFLGTIQLRVLKAARAGILSKVYDVLHEFYDDGEILSCRDSHGLTSLDNASCYDVNFKASDSKYLALHNSVPDPLLCYSVGKSFCNKFAEQEDISKQELKEFIQETSSTSKSFYYQSMTPEVIAKYLKVYLECIPTNPLPSVTYNNTTQNITEYLDHVSHHVWKEPIIRSSFTQDGLYYTAITITGSNFSEFYNFAFRCVQERDKDGQGNLVKKYNSDAPTLFYTSLRQFASKGLTIAVIVASQKTFAGNLQDCIPEMLMCNINCENAPLSVHAGIFRVIGVPNAHPRISMEVHKASGLITSIINPEAKWMITTPLTKMTQILVRYFKHNKLEDKLHVSQCVSPNQVERYNEKLSLLSEVGINISFGGLTPDKIKELSTHQYFKDGKIMLNSKNEVEGNVAVIVDFKTKLDWEVILNWSRIKEIYDFKNSSGNQTFPCTNASSNFKKNEESSFELKNGEKLIVSPEMRESVYKWFFYHPFNFASSEAPQVAIENKLLRDLVDQEPSIVVLGASGEKQVIDPALLNINGVSPDLFD